MKMFFLLALTLVLATSALAQGKVRLVNDSLHLVFWNPNCDALFVGDKTLAGHVYTLGDGGETLTVELWAGTSSNSLSIVATTSFSGQHVHGTWPGVNVVLPFPGGVPAYFQINIYDGAAGSWFYAVNFCCHYYAQTPIFTAIPGTSVLFNSLIDHAAAASTWPDGTYSLDTDVAPGARGCIMLTGFMDWQEHAILSIRPAAPGQVTIDWTLSPPFYSSFYLQVSDTLIPGGWTNAPSGNTHPVTLSVAGSPKFYRLIKLCP